LRGDFVNFNVIGLALADQAGDAVQAKIGNNQVHDKIWELNAR
jgi:hypothetical protein